jgi:glycosyltransferase involved in cell wall biosynthesis
MSDSTGSSKITEIRPPRGQRYSFALVVPWELHHAGGVNRVVCDLYSELDKRRTTKPLVVISSWKHKTPTFGLDSGGRRTMWMRLRAPFYGGRLSLKVASYAIHALAELWRAWHLTRAFDIRTVNIHYVTGVAFTWALLRWTRLYKGLVILSFHGTDLRNLSSGDWVARGLIAWMLRRADRLVVPSNDMAERLRNSFRVTPKLIRVVHNGVDPIMIRRAAQSASQTADAASDNRLIVSAGTFDAVKGHDILLQAFVGLRMDHKDAKLIIAGRAGSQLAQTQLTIRSAGLEGCVQLCVNASHEKALFLLNRARVVAVPSRREGFGLVIVEAGVLGKAVVASAVGGIPEIIRDHVDGILVGPEDPDALRQALSTVLADPALARTLGESLQRRVLEEFTLTRMVAEYLR